MGVFGHFTEEGIRDKTGTCLGTCREEREAKRGWFTSSHVKMGVRRKGEEKKAQILAKKNGVLEMNRDGAASPFF